MSLNKYKLIRIDGVNTRQGFVLVLEGSPEHQAYLAELGRPTTAPSETQEEVKNEVSKAAPKKSPTKRR